ncbi:reverse transcriptase domain-containing protein [Tanacetum coccineum]
MLTYVILLKILQQRDSRIPEHVNYAYAFSDFSEGSARLARKEPSRLILTWDDLVSKFINQFFPPSKTTNLRNEITRFQQRFDESFYEAWDRFNDLLRACPHHGFSELHQLDTFYNALNANDQDSLNSAAGGNFLDKMPRECLRIIESKSKVRNSRNKAVVAKVSSNSSTPGISPDVAALTTEVSELKNLMKTMLIDKQKAQAPATVKAVEQSCVTCGGTNFNQNRGSNFNQGQVYQPPTIQTLVYQAPPQLMQGVSKTDFENYVKAKDAYTNMQNQGQGLQNQMTNLTEMLSNSLLQYRVVVEIRTSTSQTVTNPREHVNAITTRSGKTCEGPSTPLVPTPVVSTPLKEPEQTGTSMDKVQKPSSENTAQVPPLEDHDFIPKPKAKKTVPEPNSLEPDSYQPKLPYHERMKVREKDKPNEPFSGSTTNHSDALPLSSSPVKTSDNFEEFADELTLLKKGVHEENFQVYSNPLFEFDDNFNSSNENPLFNEIEEDVENKNSSVSNSDEPVLLNTPLTDKVESFASEDEIDEIDAFLAMEVSSNIEEGYFDSEGDVIFLENLLSDNTTHNLAPKVISDHESIHNTSITFSPRNDPLHHEFAGELIALPSRIVREHEDYLSRMTCSVRFQPRSRGNMFMLTELIIRVSPVTLSVEDSEPV